MMVKIKEAVSYFKKKRDGREKETPVRSLRDRPPEKETEKDGWISPAYSQCCSIHLDPAFIAENRCLAYLTMFLRRRLTGFCGRGYSS